MKASGLTKKGFSSFHDKVAEVQECIMQLHPFAGETFVIKCGGSMMDDENFLTSFASDIAILNSLGISTVIVHGAGKQLEKMLAKFKLKNEFFDGYRVTDAETMEVVEMVMSGQINQNFVKHLIQKKVNAIGLSCKDGNLVTVKKIRRTSRDEGSNIERIIDLGFVGEPETVNCEFLEQIIEDAMIVPVISPVAFDKNYHTYSVNADVLACAIGKAIKAQKVIIISENNNIHTKNGVLSGSISLPELEKVLYNSIIPPELVVRIKSCVDAMRDGVENVHIIDAVSHTLMAELTCGVTTGTMIYNDVI